MVMGVGGMLVGVCPGPPVAMPRPKHGGAPRPQRPSRADGAVQGQGFWVLLLGTVVLRMAAPCRGGPGGQGCS